MTPTSASEPNAPAPLSQAEYRDLLHEKLRAAIRQAAERTADLDVSLLPACKTNHRLAGHGSVERKRHNACSKYLSVERKSRSDERT